MSAVGQDGWQDPRTVLRRHGLRANRAYSQNFLISRHHAQRIVSALGAQPLDVVELGPGLGTLTAMLLARGHRVRAVDKDPNMVAVVREELGDRAGLQTQTGDAQTVSLAPQGGSVAVVGNLPYGVTGSIVRNLVGQASSVRRAVIMVQLEVAQRLCAPPGTKAYGALTVFTGASFEVTPVVTLTPGCFYPAPKVKSAVIMLEPHPVPRAEETPTFRRVVSAAFQGRRKTLVNALKQAGFEGEATTAALLRLGLSPSARGETLSVEQFNALSAELPFQ